MSVREFSHARTVAGRIVWRLRDKVAFFGLCRSPSGQIPQLPPREVDVGGIMGRTDGSSRPFQ